MLQLSNNSSVLKYTKKSIFDLNSKSNFDIKMEHVPLCNEMNKKLF